MTTCRFCAEEIQDAAIVCRHCGRDLLKATAAPIVRQPSHTGRNVLLIVGGLFILLLIIGALNSPTAKPGQPSKTLDVTVKTSAIALEITNDGSAEAAGHEMIVYINGSPPFTYKAVAEVPPVGQHVRIPLTTFTQKDGTRFNPLATAVTVIWVGGGGYDYRSFGK